jgi:NADPH2:quinone reductase
MGAMRHRRIVVTRYGGPDAIALLDLLRQGKIKPLIAQRFPLVEARQAQELLEKGGVTGKIVLVCSPDGRDAQALGA